MYLLKGNEVIGYNIFISIIVNSGVCIIIERKDFFIVGFVYFK